MDEKKQLNEITIKDIICIYGIVSIALFAIMVVMVLNQVSIGDDEIYLLNIITEAVVCVILLHKLKLSRIKLKNRVRNVIGKINFIEVIKLLFYLWVFSIGAYILTILLIKNIDIEFLTYVVFDSFLFIPRNIPAYFLINIVFIFFLIPIVDEIIFRKVLFTRISEKFNTKVGLVVSCIIFAAFYMGLGVMGSFALAVICCIIYMKYKDIIVPIIFHFINNVIMFVFSLFVLKFPIDFNGVFRCVLFGIFGAGLFILGFVLIIRYINSNREYYKL